MGFSLSVVIPQYNEQNNLQKGVLKEVYEYLKTSDFDWELIISDDGSTDKSLELSRKFCSELDDKRVIILSNKHGGKANALNEGIKIATKEWTLITDMDQSAPITELSKLIAYTDEYYVIIGSRGLRRHSESLFRQFASLVFSTIRRIVVLREINDTQCGFKLFKTKPLKQIFPKLDVLKKFEAKGWTVTAFDVELLHLLQIAEYEIAEARIHWLNRDNSITKNRGNKFVLESIDMLRQLAHISICNITGYYKKLLVDVRKSQ